MKRAGERLLRRFIDEALRDGREDDGLPDSEGEVVAAKELLRQAAQRLQAAVSTQHGPYGTSAKRRWDRHVEAIRDIVSDLDSGSYQ